MPFKRGSSRKTISYNIGEGMKAMRAGSKHLRTRDQVIAAALSMAGRSNRRHTGRHRSTRKR